VLDTDHRGERALELGHPRALRNDARLKDAPHRGLFFFAEQWLRNWYHKNLLIVMR
jgi:hypothetical protein